MSYYGTLLGANAYFDARLHSEGWSDSDATDRPKAMAEASRLIDSLNYKGVKNSVWLVMYEANTYQTGNYQKILVSPPSRQDIIDADATQELEFPRGQSTSVPVEIEWACYEISLALLEGFDPEDAIDRTNVTQQVYSAVKTAYDNNSVTSEYLVYGIPTARVWRWLKPFLTDGRILKMSRAD